MLRMGMFSFVDHQGVHRVFLTYVSGRGNRHLAWSRAARPSEIEAINNPLTLPLELAASLMVVARLMRRSEPRYTPRDLTSASKDALQISKSHYLDCRLRLQEDV
jgi:hypothetical protein